MLDPVKGLGPSIIRTWTPLVVAFLASLLSPKLGITNDQFTVAVTLVFGGVYYLIARLVEVFIWPKVGWLLGYGKAPAEYVKGEVLASHDHPHI